ncbi:MAG TPA: alpha-ketoglutarate-dependent dioxygenase AlkB [Xanthomonadaceae bacterium]|jgi:alkylated DNA repair dioxygenase AlkB
MTWERIDLRDADLRYDARWLAPAESDALFAALREGIAWECHRIRLFGREVSSPRLSCWIGDADAAYTYSRTRFEPRPWPEALRALCERLRDEHGVDFNGVLANLYRDGRDGMGWHADDEPEIDPRAPIASLSLGAPRRFALRHRGDRALRTVIELGHGSLLLMAGDTQRHWQHALPKTARVVGPRINLTFRRILAQSGA